MSLSSHQSAEMKSDSWLTPPEIIHRLGHFDMDPCCPETMPWETADTMWTKRDCPLEVEWRGRVWMNPPFGREAAIWLEKLSYHNYGTALVAARTETKWFFDFIWARASSILFLRGRPHFHYPDGTKAKFNSGAPICLVGYGEYDARKLYEARDMGAYVDV